MHKSKFKNINRGYISLEVWRESVDLAVRVRNLLKLSKNISLKVKSQTEDSIVSVASNIAEGYSRRFIKEYIQHLNYSLASLSENYTQILILNRSDDISDEWFEEYDKLHYSLENKLLALIKSLIRKLKQQDQWDSDYKIKEVVEKYDNV